MKTFGSLVLIALTAAWMFGCGSFSANAPPQDWVEQTLGQMTLEEKIGQLLFPGVSAAAANQEGEVFQKVQEHIQKYHVCGYHIDGSSQATPASVASLITRMQQLARVPLLITGDFEGGVGYQFPGATRFPRAMAIGATGNPQYAYEAADFTAQEAKAVGASVNFYPVVDVNNNALNPIINIRSFGEDAKNVSEFGAAYVRGIQDGGLVATAKHFPGHGDTSVDSHLQLPVLDVDRARLDAVELPPFVATINVGVKAVMVGHISVPQIDRTPGLPASLSPTITTGLLRQELGFRGLVFTDALVMGAIVENFGAEQAVVMAIQAGADVALIPSDVPKAFEALQAAVSQGEITEQRLDESVRRLLAAKADVGLNLRRTPDLDQVERLVGSPAAREKSQEIMEHALTLVKDDNNSLPLNLPPDEEVLLVNFLDAGGAYADTPGGAFRAEFLKHHDNTLLADVPPSTTASEADVIRQLALGYRTVVVSCSIRVAAYSGVIGLTDVQQDLLRSLAQHDGPFVFALFGSPYLLNSIPELPGYALAFEFYQGAEEAMVRAIFGEVRFQGKLPTTVGSFPVGFGLEK